MSSLFLNIFRNSRIYPITDREISGLSHADQVVHLSDRGATIVQLREKKLSPLAFYREAQAALRIARDRGVKLIINDRVDIALALKAEGVHLGQDDMPPEAARRVLGSRAIIGLSTHNLEQARQAMGLPIDYLAIGPVFPTNTKAPSDPPVGLECLRQIRTITSSIPLVAIGGITLENCQEVQKAGADVTAIIRDIWRPRVLPNSPPNSRP